MMVDSNTDQAGHMYKFPDFADMPPALQDLINSNRDVARYMESRYESFHDKAPNDTERDVDDVDEDDSLEPSDLESFPTLPGKQGRNGEIYREYEKAMDNFFERHPEYAANPDCSDYFEDKKVLFWDKDKEEYCEILVKFLMDQALCPSEDRKISDPITVDDDFTGLLLEEAAFFTRKKTGGNVLLVVPKKKRPVTTELKEGLILKALLCAGDKRDEDKRMIAELEKEKQALEAEKGMNAESSNEDDAVKETDYDSDKTFCDDSVKENGAVQGQDASKETVKGLNKSNISDETLDEENEAVVQNSRTSNACRTDRSALIAHLDNISSKISHRIELVKLCADDDTEGDAELAKIYSLMNEGKRLCAARLGNDESM